MRDRMKAYDAILAQMDNQIGVAVQEIADKLP